MSEQDERERFAKDLGADPQPRWIDGKLPLLLPYREAARYFDVTPAAFLNWVHKGRIKVIRTSRGGSGRILVEGAEVERLLALMREASQPGVIHER